MAATENAVRNFPPRDAPKEAWLYEKTVNRAVVCNLCAHRCFVPSGRIGICKVRENRAGTLYTLVHNHVISLNIDPVESNRLDHGDCPSCQTAIEGVWDIKNRSVVTECKLARGAVP